MAFSKGIRLIGLLILIGCVPAKPVQLDKPDLIKEPVIQHQKTIVEHQYELLVVDVDGSPVNGAKIDYSMKDGAKLVKSKSFITSSDGKLKDSLNVTSLFWYTIVYKSSLEYEVSKDGYYPTSGELRSDDSSLKTTKVTLKSPLDYLSKQFILSISDMKLKAKIITLVDLIVLQGLVTDSILENKSIDVISFKNNKYLKFKFNNTNVYNSLKLNKYDIGKKLFDDVIRKVLNPLNEYIGGSDLFYGYDLTVTGYTKSFADDYASSKPIEYRFLIPEKIVRQYKEKDISGQQVLDSSIILMDDERIELKLQ
ncbi:MAG: hypothetical protein Q8O04_07345 [Deltaproteobacteria bacterium]|nr:hypothetical protein [Deltaproteobacteria bacterium]